MNLYKIFKLYLVLTIIQIPFSALFFQGGLAGTVFFGVLDFFTFFLLCIYFFLAKKFYLSTSIIRKKFLYLYLFFSWAFFSSIWSVSDDINYGLMLLARDLIRSFIIIIGALLIRRDGLLKILVDVNMIVLVLYPLLFLSTASFSYDSGMGQGRLMYEGYKDANSTSRDIGMIILLASWILKENLYKNNQVITIFLLVNLIALLISFSKTVSIALFVSINISYVFYKINFSLKIKMIFIFFALTLFFILFRADYIYQYLYDVQGGSALETVSGRTSIWSIAIESIQKNPLFGNGINSFGTFSYILPNQPRQAHNELLNIFSAYGIVGLVVIILVYLQLFKSITRLINVDRSRLIISFIIFYLIVGLTEGNIVTSVFPIWLIVLLTIIGLPQRNHNDK